MRKCIKKCTLNFDVADKFKGWLAGLIDGEGNFYISKDKRHPRIRLVLQERDKFVLELIASKIGGKLTYRKPQKSWKPNCKPQWLWGLSSHEECLIFAKWIEEALILKKETCTKFIAQIEEKKIE
jgi:hypothetical protein